MAAILDALESVSDQQADGDSESDLLKMWYKEDKNAIPPEYVLQPIVISLSSDKGWRKFQK